MDDRPTTTAQLLQALRGGDLEVAAHLLARRQQELEALDPRDRVALRAAETENRELQAALSARKEHAEAELRGLQRLRGRLASRRSARRGARFIETHA